MTWRGWIEKHGSNW